jgi:CHAT domain-containing protein
MRAIRQMKGAAYALVAVAGAVWPLVMPAGSARAVRVAERVGQATDLGARGRFDGVRHRRSGPPALSDLQALARRSDEELNRARTVSSLRAAALLREAAGQTQAALALLEEAAALAPDDAGVATDRAALLLDRAGTPLAVPGDLALALELSRSALATRPSAAARFNRAAALESLGLTGVARQAWREYLEADRGSPWRDEALARLARLEGRVRPEDAPASPDGRARSGGAEAVPERPMQARLLVEEDLLGRWGRAEGSAEGDSALDTARALAAALRERQGDGLLAEAVAAIDRAGPPARGALASGHARYQDGVELAAREEWTAAAAAFADAQGLLARGRSPFAAYARLQVGVCAYYRPDYAGALAAFERVLEEEPTRPLLRARALWLAGLVRFVTGRAFEALREHEEARAIFVRAGEPAHAAFLDSLLAADQQALGRRDLAWEARSRALRGLDDIGDARRVFSVLWDGARACLEEGLPWAARDFLDELAVRRELEGEPVLRASTLVRRARAAQRVGDWRSAASDLLEVRRLQPSLPQPIAQRLTADLRVAEAEIAAVRDPPAAMQAYSEALAFLEGTGNALQSATLRRSRAAVYTSLGQPDAAQGDLEWVLRSFEESRMRLSDEVQRVAFFELARGAGDDLIALHLDARRPWAALAAAERTRARGLLGRLSAGDATPAPFELRKVQAALRPGSALLEYAVLEDRLVIWVVGPESAHVVVQDTPAVEIERLAAHLHRDVRASEPAAARETLEHLHALLLAPAAPLLVDARTLFMVPDKALHRVPFAALLDGRSQRYLAEDAAVVSVASATLFARGTSEPEGALRRVLVVVNGEAESGWPALPAAGEEGRRIAAIYPESRVLENGASTPGAVLDRLWQSDVLHVAAHAVSGRDPRTSGLVLRGDTGGPALLTAEALGAGSRAGPPRVAVLASCRTAEGTSSLEGPLSLARGFLALGTSSVVATLWDLPDAAALRLLPGLHRRLAGGQPTAEALRAVQVDAIRAAGRDADLAGWASLVVVGGSASLHERPRE